MTSSTGKKTTQQVKVRPQSDPLLVGSSEGNKAEVRRLREFVVKREQQRNARARRG